MSFHLNNLRHHFFQMALSPGKCLCIDFIFDFGLIGKTELMDGKLLGR